ncbi:hypothetical protein JF110_001649 [Campylobacter jejuni]|nr:hypothetical protein [Campylobacter jejuni]
MIKMILTRTKEWASSTTGELVIMNNDEVLFECKTLENLIEGNERNKDFRVPEGIYKVGLRKSPRFGKTPHLYNDEVPADRYILMHKGNTDKDTEGCIIVGMEVVNGTIKGGTSKPGFDGIMDILEANVELGDYTKCELEIRNNF